MSTYKALRLFPFPRLFCLLTRHLDLFLFPSPRLFCLPTRHLDLFLFPSPRLVYLPTRHSDFFVFLRWFAYLQGTLTFSFSFSLFGLSIYKALRLFPSLRSVKLQDQRVQFPYLLIAGGRRDEYFPKDNHEIGILCPGFKLSLPNIFSKTICVKSLSPPTEITWCRD